MKIKKNFWQERGLQILQFWVLQNGWAQNHTKHFLIWLQTNHGIITTAGVIAEWKNWTA